MRLFAHLSILGSTLALLAFPAAAQSDKKPNASPAVRAQAVRIDAPQLRLAPKLPDSKRLELMNKALADLKLPPIPKPPVSTTRVTARVPVSPAGAVVAQANPRVYVSQAASDPDGYFGFGAATANGGGDMIKLQFPVESGKLYLLECKVRTESGMPVMFSNEVGAPVTESIVPVNDHVIVAVRATSTRLQRVIQSKASHWWWSACDIAPAN